MRQEIGSLREETGSLRAELAELRERMARIEGLLEAVFMRRDLTPLPEPPLVRGGRRARPKPLETAAAGAGRARAAAGRTRPPALYFGTASSGGGRIVVRFISLRERPSNGSRRCIVQALSHSTASPWRHSCR